jgi:hypothetical protein
MVKIKEIKNFIKENQFSLWWRPEGQSSMCEAHRLTLGDCDEILGICNCGSHNMQEGEEFILFSLLEIREFIEGHEECPIFIPGIAKKEIDLECV